MAEDSIKGRDARYRGRQVREDAGSAGDTHSFMRPMLTLLRDPTPEMIKAGARTLTGLQPTAEAMAEAIWQRMIDAALDEADLHEE